MLARNTIKKDPAPTIGRTVPWKLIDVQPLSDYRLLVKFTDDTIGVVNMKNLLAKNDIGVFTPLKDVNIFNQVHLAHGVVTWNDEVDLAPDAMYKEIKANGSWTIG